MEHLEINKLTDEKIKREELAFLQSQHVSKKRYERIKPFANFLNYLAHFCQTNSFSLAACGTCAALWVNMGSSGVPFMIFCIFGFIMVEIAVWMSMKTHSSMKFDDKVVSPVIYVGLFISLGISTPTTYYTTPYAVQFFTSAPNLIDTANVRIQEDIKIKTDTTYWHTKYMAAQFKADEYFVRYRKRDCDTCPLRLSTKGNSRDIHSLMEKDASVLQDSINVYLAKGENRKRLELNKAVSKNEATMDKHFAWCESFGLIMALISILAMAILIPCRYYYEYWKRKYEKELEADIERQEAKEKEAIQEIKSNHNGNTATNTDKAQKTNTDTIQTPHRVVMRPFGTNKETVNNRTCSNCGTDISTKRSDAKFCSTKCRGLHHKAKTK